MKRPLLVLAGAAAFAIASACNGQQQQTAPPPKVAPVTPPSAFGDADKPSPFAPAFTRIEVAPGATVDTGRLGDAIQCVGCHADVVAQWETSAHRSSSFNNRFYAASVALTREHRGNKVSRWCAGCHDPSLLLANATATSVDPLIDRDDVATHPRSSDGIGCLVCHSMTEGSRLGGGGYLVKWQGFVEPDVKNPASVAKHKLAVKAKAMSEAELCASCHKVSLHADVNGKRWLRGQNDFDAWEQGPYAFGGKKTAGVIYAPDVEPQRCQDCHMKHEQTKLNDLAGKPLAGKSDKHIRSHRFLAANTALAALVDDKATIAMQSKALEGVVRVEVMGVRRATTPMIFEPLANAKLAGGDRVAIDVVVENVGVGHRFPGGTVDSNEVWLAIEVRDAKGKLVAQSGALDEQNALGEEAHRFGVLQLDNAGVPALLRDAHRFTAAGWDTTIGPRDARVMRYALEVPNDAALPLTASARVLFRKFTAPYTKVACTTTKASFAAPKLPTCPKLPIVEVARDLATFGVASASSIPAWRRLDAYARGLLNAVQEEVGDAGPILSEVVRLAPDHAEGFIDLARLFIRQGRTVDADAQLALAAKIDPTTPVIPFLRGVARYEIYRLAEAIDPLRRAVAFSPQNVHAAELLGEALQLAGDDLAALDVVHKALHVDPESAQLRHLEALSFDRLGRAADAEFARAAYLKYRRDDDTPKLRTICKMKVPGCAREANPLHTHELFPPG